MRRQLEHVLPLIYTRTALRWPDIEAMPRGERELLIAALMG